MKKQIHIKLADKMHQQLKELATNQEKTMQDYMVEVIDEKIKEQMTMYEFLDMGKPKNASFTFIDLFAGIGGMRLGFEKNGGQCVFSSEWDKFCQQTYYENFGTMPEGDVTKIDEKRIPDHDILVAGFPCQPFSIAGVSKKNSLGREHGFLDKTQGTLFFEIVRILKHKRPKAFLLENVKNLLTHDKKNTFKVIKEALESLNYKIYFKVLDGKNYVPQHRERIYIVGMDRSVYGDEDLFVFPEMKSANHVVQDILLDDVDAKYTLTDHQWNYLKRYKEKHEAKGNGFGYGLAPLDGVSRTLSARYYKDGSEILIPQEDRNPRRLTPRECARLQGFPDTFKIVVSNTQAYKQFGNSVVVPLIEDIAKQMRLAMELEEHAQEEQAQDEQSA